MWNGHWIQTRTSTIDTNCQKILEKYSKGLGTCPISLKRSSTCFFSRESLLKMKKRSCFLLHFLFCYNIWNITKWLQCYDEQIFSLSKENGKKCHMLSAKAVVYKSPNVKYTNCKRSERSRFNFQATSFVSNVVSDFNHAI